MIMFLIVICSKKCGVGPIQAMRRALNGKMQVVAKVASSDKQSAMKIKSLISTESLNQQLLANGLPSGQIVSVSVSATVNGDGATLSVTYVVLIVLFFFLATIMTGISVFRFYSEFESEEEIALAAKISEVQAALKIELQDGFVLSTDKVPFWRRRYNYVQIPRSHVEAAARLSMFKDFDVGEFDALCILLRRMKPGETGYSIALRNIRRLSLTSESVRSQRPAELLYQSQQWMALNKWLLAICEDLVRPKISRLKLGNNSFYYKMSDDESVSQEKEHFLFFRWLHST